MQYLYITSRINPCSSCSYQSLFEYFSVCVTKGFFATDLVNICCFLLISSSTEYPHFEALLLDDLLTGV